MDLKLTARCACITGQRSEKMVQIIDHLRAGAARRYEIDEIIGQSPSGCRKYLFDLVENQIIAQHPDHARGRASEHLFELSKDAARVAEFIRLITLPGIDGKPRRCGPLAQRIDESRKFHLLQDDEAFKVKIAPLKPPGQFRLLAQFFGLIQPEGLVPAEGLLS